MTDIFLGSDHAGFALKERIKTYLQGKSYQVHDEGCTSSDTCDYPAFGQAVAQKVVAHRNALGIIICGSGIGISIAANKVKGARAVLAYSKEMAQLGRAHNGAQILALGGRTHLFDDALSIVDTFLGTEIDFDERHQRRRNQLDAL